MVAVVFKRPWNCKLTEITTPLLPNRSGDFVKFQNLAGPIMHNGFALCVCGRLEISKFLTWPKDVTIGPKW